MENNTEKKESYIDELRKYNRKENPYTRDEMAYYLLDIAGLTNCNDYLKVKRDVENALEYWEILAENPYNCDYFKTFYNILIELIKYNEGFYG